MTKKQTTLLGSIGNQAVNILRKEAVKHIKANIPPPLRGLIPRARVGGMRAPRGRGRMGRLAGGGRNFGGQIQPVINQGGEVHVYLSSGGGFDVSPTPYNNPFSNLKQAVSIGNEMVNMASSYMKPAPPVAIKNIVSNAGLLSTNLGKAVAGISLVGAGVLAGKYGPAVISKIPAVIGKIPKVAGAVSKIGGFFRSAQNLGSQISGISGPTRSTRVGVPSPLAGAGAGGAGGSEAGTLYSIDYSGNFEGGLESRQGDIGAQRRWIEAHGIDLSRLPDSENPAKITIV